MKIDWRLTDAAQSAGRKVAAFSEAAHFVPPLDQRLKDTRSDWFCTNTEGLKRMLNQF